MDCYHHLKDYHSGTMFKFLVLPLSDRDSNGPRLSDCRLRDYLTILVSLSYRFVSLSLPLPLSLSCTHTVSGVWKVGAKMQANHLEAQSLDKELESLVGNQLWDAFRYFSVGRSLAVAGWTSLSSRSLTYTHSLLHIHTLTPYTHSHAQHTFRTKPRAFLSRSRRSNGSTRPNSNSWCAPACTAWDSGKRIRRTRWYCTTWSTGIGVWLSGCLVVWLSGCLAVWLSGCLAVWFSHSPCM